MPEIIKMPGSEFSPLEEMNENELIEITDGLLFNASHLYAKDRPISKSGLFQEFFGRKGQGAKA